MGASCCHCQRLDDPLLSLPPASSMRPSLEHLYVPAPLTAVSGSVSSSTSSPRSTSSSVRQSLANYISFPFTFKLKAEMNHSSKNCKNSRIKSQPDSQYGPNSRPPAPYVGEHWRKTSSGRFVPLSLRELTVRSLCAKLLSIDHDVLQPSFLPSEVAASALQWLRQHAVLDKPQFQTLVPFLLMEWKTSGHQDVVKSWFNNIPETTQRSVKSIDVSGCIHLKQLGSKNAQVCQLPELITASFRGCTQLSNMVVETLKLSTKLTALDLSGCINVDDTDLKILHDLDHLKSLQLVGCCKVTDVGVNSLLQLTQLEKLHLGRCQHITDKAFESFADSFPKLRELDVAYCRLSERAMQSIGRVKRLEKLVIRGCQAISDDGIRALAQLTSLMYFDARYCRKIHSVPHEWTHLQFLLLGHTAFAESDVTILQSLTNLQELELCKCHIKTRGLELISRLTCLQRLELEETALTDSALVKICSSASRLEALNISNTEIGDGGAAGLEKLKELRILRLDTLGITDRALAHISFLSQLERLDLFGANITDNGLIHLILLSKLQELTICGGNISDRGVGYISKLTSLTTLNLSQNRNIRAKSLYYLRSLTNLRCLNLSNTGISAESLRYLSPLKALQSLSVYGCSLSQNHIDGLRELLPELKRLRCT